MAQTEIIVQSAKEMAKAGEILAQETLKKRVRAPLIIGLKGELGAGKTIFTQGFAGGLGIKDKITSPTFVIFKKYSFDSGAFYHVDCYRIESAVDLAELDFGEILRAKENIVLIEWAEKIKEILPKNTLWINFKYLDRSRRKIVL